MFEFVDKGSHIGAAPLLQRRPALSASVRVNAGECVRARAGEVDWARKPAGPTVRRVLHTVHRIRSTRRLFNVLGTPYRPGS
ncbi:hypothetical protein [Streptomyces sp. RG80]|uniref:hypothetical protein n=1 Tax=Streptomyces sp. RG80 TaxID=3157340 RepID=UPI00338F529E